MAEPVSRQEAPKPHVDVGPLERYAYRLRLGLWWRRLLPMRERPALSD